MDDKFPKFLKVNSALTLRTANSPAFCQSFQYILV